MRILYDGWTLLTAPDSAPALHLLHLLEAAPPGAERIVALPGEPAFPLPPGVASWQLPTRGRSASPLEWEQRLLPRAARETGTDWLHLTGAAAPLFSPGRTLLSPNTILSKETPRGFQARLRQALAQGGQQRLAATLWPADLPPPGGAAAVRRLPPAVHPAFRESGGRCALGDLPADAVVAHDITTQSALESALAAWAWAAGPLGAATPLVLSGLRPDLKPVLEEIQQASGLPADSLVIPPPLPVHQLAALFRHSAAVLFTGPLVPWESPARLALAWAAPLVAVETPRSDALCGPAAYLVPGSPDLEKLGRQLGAALLTVIVEESMGEALRQAARERTAGWGNGFKDALEKMYSA